MVESGYAEVLFYGVNYSGNPHDLPVMVWPANVHGGDPDPYGRARFAHRILLDREPIDIFYFLQDHFTLSWRVPFPDGQDDQFVPGLLARMRAQVADGRRPPFKAVQYVPVDSDNVLPEFLTGLAGTTPRGENLLDAVVAYLHFGRRVILDAVPGLDGRVHVIPHGTRPDIFTPFPLERRIEHRKNIFGAGPNVPILINVNRNQPRKDVVRSLQVFKRVLKTFPDAIYYCHMNVADSMGYHLERARVNLRIPAGRVIFPANFSEGRGVSVEDLNGVYNCGDLFMTTARGEGFGLTISESMSAGCPVVAPDHTSFSEILADNRGVLVPCREDREIMLNDFDQLRPVVDPAVMADAVTALLLDGDRREEIARNAITWARELTWARVSKTWESLFEHLLGGGTQAVAAPQPGSPVTPGERRSLWLNQ